TPAEVHMASVLGADLVGMSTALEAIAARRAGMDLLGISLVTNLAAGISGDALSHGAVLEAGREAGPRISRLLAEPVRRVAGGGARGRWGGGPQDLPAAGRDGAPDHRGRLGAGRRRGRLGMSVEAGLRTRVEAWIRDDPDPATRAALEALLEEAETGSAAALDEIADAFAADLQFGTAGLRGAMGPGPNRMNLAVVSRAARGLADHLRLDVGLDRPHVVIGYDARHNSRDFARRSAEIMTAAGC